MGTYRIETIEGEFLFEAKAEGVEQILRCAEIIAGGGRVLAAPAPPPPKHEHEWTAGQFNIKHRVRRHEGRWVVEWSHTATGIWRHDNQATKFVAAEIAKLAGLVPPEDPKP